MSRRRRAIIAVVIGIGAAFLFLPVFLMSEPVVSLLQREVAHNIPGTLEVGSCSVGWLDGLRCEQVRYRNPGQGLHCETSLLTTDKGLVPLLAAPSYLGEITLNQPSCTFSPTLPGNGQPHQTSSGNPANGAASPDASLADTPWWERLTLRLKILQGKALLEPGNEPARLLAHRIDLAGSVAMGTVSYDLSLFSGEQKGEVKAKGLVHLPRAGQTSLETLISQTDIAITNLELSDFFELAASRSSLPRGKGVLNATAQVTATGNAEFESQGDATVLGLQLDGGVFGADHPQVDRLHASFKGSRRQIEGWRLTALALQSDPIDLHATGGFNNQEVTLAVKGRVNMPALATKLPHLLRIHDRTTIVEGTTGFSLAVSGSPDAFRIRADCRADQLRFVHDRQPYSWTAPLGLEVEADYGRDRSGLRTLRLIAPFFEAHGTSGPEGFSLRGGGDLDRMFQEFRKVLALDIHAGGRAEVNATSTRDGDGGVRLGGRLTIDDFSLHRGAQTVLPAHPLLLAGTILSPSLLPGKSTFHLASLEATAWPGTLSLRSDDPLRRAEQQGNGQVLKGVVDLGRLSDVVRGVEGEARWPVLRGALQFEAVGERQNNFIAVRQLQGTVDRLSVAGEGFSVQEPRLMFRLGGVGGKSPRPVAVQGLMIVEDWQDFTEKVTPLLQVDIDRQRIEVRRLAWGSARAALEGDCLIENWLRPETGSSFALRGEADGALLEELVKVWGILPKDLAARGRVRGDWSYRADRDQQRGQALSLEVASFALLRGKKAIAADPLLTAHVRVQYSGAQPDEIQIADFRLGTAAVTAVGSGLLTRKETPELALHGQLTPQYVQLAPLLHPYVGRETAFSGSRSGGFHLSLPLTSPLQWERMSLLAELPVDTLRFQGINVGPLTLPLELHRNKLRLRIDGQLDGGRVALAPLWDLSVPQPLLTIPTNTPCLTNVPVKAPLIDGILGRLHPLFGGLAQVQGVVDVRINQFSMPIFQKAGQGPAFTVAVAVDRLQFKPTEPLQELFDLNGYDQEWYRCQEREIQCEGKNGRVRCQPVHLLVGDDVVAFKGEISQDRHLQYAVHFPLSGQLAEKAKLSVPGEIPVVAEINGTVHGPRFDAEAFVASLATQLRKTGQLTEHKETEAEQPENP